jgi:hypothetical protein
LYTATSSASPSSRLEPAVSTATLEFPRLLPGHEQAAELLLEWAFKALMKKGVTRISGRITTMCPGDIDLAEKMGFTMCDWGYKVYYNYKMDWGKLSDSGGEVGGDFENCCELV